MKRFFKWFLMLCKRLYKKPSFVAILLLIPISILAINITSKEDSGFVHVVLAEMDKNDEISSQVVKKLLQQDALIRFTYCDDPKEAEQMVRQGEADSAWIFAEDMDEHIEQYVKEEFKAVDTVTVYEREITVPLRLAHEILFSAMQNYTSEAFYIHYARTEVPELDFLSDEELLDYYHATNTDEEFFIYETASGKGLTTSNTNYIIAPIRGFLSILAVMSAFAGVLFYMQDKKRGTFALVPENKLIYVAFACIFIAVLNVSVFICLSLIITGLSIGIITEILCIFLYSLCCVGFTILIMQVCRSIKALVSILPIFIIIMFVLCPVFFDLRSKLAFQLLLPPTYFINASYDKNYLLYMVIYSIVCIALSFIIKKIRKKSVD